MQTIDKINVMCFIDKSPATHVCQTVLLGRDVLCPKLYIKFCHNELNLSETIGQKRGSRYTII